jgi:WD40 repeat protein
MMKSIYNTFLGKILYLKSQTSLNKNLLRGMSLAASVIIAPIIQYSSAVPAGDSKQATEPELIPVILPNRSSINPQIVYSFREHLGSIKSLAFSPDSKTLVSGGGESDGIIRLWDTKTGKRTGTISRAHTTAVESLLIAPDGVTLASCSDDNSINLWNLRSNNFTRSFVAHRSPVLSIAVTPDSKILVSGALDGIRMWDLLQQRPLATLARYDNPITTVAISPDGQTLASGDSKGVIKLWNLNTGRVINTVPGAHTSRVSELAFTPDGGTLVSASYDRTIKLWNPNTAQALATLSGHNNRVFAIAINPNGQLLASGGSDGIKLWNLTTGELINTLYGHNDWVSALSFSPDGQMLASGGYDKRINIWRL